MPACRPAASLRTISEIRVDAGNLFTSRHDLESVVVAVDHGRPVYLRDVADQILDGPSDPANYVLFGTTNASAGARKRPQQYPAVTVTVAKRKGTNATDIANAALKRIDEMKGVQIPNDVNVTTTRNYGDTAKAKSDELLEHLLLATLSVTLLVALFLGWRESGVVLLAIPVTLALTMSTFYFLGYTINRVTLFALIFSIGILVDDAIVVVENIVRHFRLPENQNRSVQRCHGRGGRRGRQSDHSRHVRGDRRRAAHGLCARSDGPVHAADSGGRFGGHALLAHGGLRGVAVGRHAAARQASGRRASARAGA